MIMKECTRTDAELLMLLCEIRRSAAKVKIIDRRRISTSAQKKNAKNSQCLEDVKKS
jgi:hypothetical protein